MRALGILVVLSFSAPLLVAQTVLIDPNGDGGFENGPSLEANRWTVVNDGYNKWEVGVAAKNGGLRGVYISKDEGSTNSYFGHIPQVSHFYRDVTFPAELTTIVLKFYLRGGFDTDDVMVFLIPTESTPIAGIQLTSAGRLGHYYANPFHDDQYRLKEVVIPISAAGTTQRLVFSWRNNDTQEIPFPAAIDNIEIVVEGGTISNGTGGGQWSSGDTWTGGIVPSPGTNVLIRNGDNVILDTDAEVKNLSVGEGVSGGFDFDPVADRRLVVQQDVIISSGAAMTAGATGTGSHDLVIAGNFFNHGNAHFFTNGGAATVYVEFNGTDQHFGGLGDNIVDLIAINSGSGNVSINLSSMSVQNQTTSTQPWLNLVQGTVEVAGDFPMSGKILPDNHTISAGTRIILNNPNLQTQHGGSLTVNGGLSIHTGELNVGTTPSHFIILTSGSSFSANGPGKIEVAGGFCVSPPSSQVNVAFGGGGELLVGAAGGINSSANATLDLGTSSNTVFNWTNFTAFIRNSNTASSTPRDFRVPPFANVTIDPSALVRFGDAETPGPTTFRIEGILPPHVVNGSHTLLQSGNVTLPHPTIIVAGEIWNVNGFVLVALQDLSVESGATLNATPSGSIGSRVAFRGTTQQTFTNAGTSGEIRVLEINNTSGASPGVLLSSNTTVSSSLNLVNGTLGGTGTLTIGNSSVSSNFTIFRQNGGLLIIPTPGDNVIQNVQYLGSTQPTVTGIELPATLNGTLTINNSQGVVLSGSHSVANLSLSSGILTTSAQNILTVTGVTPSAVSVTSGTSFVAGPMRRIINETSPTGEYVIPIGNSTLNTVTLVNPLATGQVILEAQVFDEDAGGIPGAGLASLNSDRYWRIDAVDGVEVFVEALVAFTASGLGGGNRIGKSETRDGTYNSIGGTVANGRITSNTINGFSYFVIGTTSSTLSGGTYAVGASQSFVNLTEVASTLASISISGDVIFELQADYDGTSNETLPINFVGVTSVGGNFTVTIRPAVGAGQRTTSGDPGSGNPIINLDGAGGMVFDGREGGSGSTISWILRNTRTTTTVGPVVRFINGATSNTIRYTRIEGQNTTTTSGLVLFGTTTTSAGNSNNTITQNEIRSRSDVTGVPANLIYSSGTGGAPNASNQISGNKLFNFNSAGINLAAGGLGNGWTIENNSFYQTVAITNFSSTTGILVAAGTGHTISSNIIGGSETNAAGSPWSANATFTGINLTLGTTSVSTVQGNIIKNISLSGSFSGFTGIRLGNGMVDLIGNTIGDATTPSSIVISAGSEAIRGIFMDFTNAGTVNISGSVVANIAQTSGFPGEFRGIHMDGTGTTRVSRNLIHTVGPTGTTASGLVRGINIAGTFATANHCSIDNNMISMGNGVTNDCQYQGIRDGSVSGNIVNIYFNSVRIGGTGNGANNTYAYRRDNTTNVAVENNIFSNLRTGGTGFHVALANAAAATGWLAGSSNFNMLNNDNDQHLAQWLGTSAGNNRTLAGWQASQTDPTPGSGGDANSLSSLPHFTSETDLHLNVSSADIDYIAQPISGITIDFDGDVRSTSSPYKGADENTTYSLPDIVAPAVPLNLAVADSANGSVALRWNRNSEADLLRYRVYGGTSQNPTTKIDSTAGGMDTTKTLTGLTNGTRYYFRITAIDSSYNESVYSSQVHATPGDYVAPAAPQNLAVTDSSSGTIAIRWSRSTEPDFLRYRIYRSTSPNPVNRVDSTSLGSGDTSKVFTGLVNATRYYLRITAVDSSGNESAYSNEVNAAPADRNAPAAPQNLVVTDSSNTTITIKWSKNTEPDFLRYRIYRGTAPNPTTLTDSTTGGPADTSKTFTGLTNGARYYFRVTAVDTNGNESAYSNEVNAAPNVQVSVNDLLSQIPQEFSLSQNYPNPFNPSTVIRYGLPERSRVSIEVYDMLGQRVAILLNSEQEARYYEVIWHANVPSGVYFYRISTVGMTNPDRTFTQVRKMTLIR